MVYTSFTIQRPVRGRVCQLRGERENASKNKDTTSSEYFTLNYK